MATTTKFKVSSRNTTNKKQKYLNVGDVSKLNVFRKGNPDWMSEVSMASAKQLDRENNKLEDSDEDGDIDTNDNFNVDDDDDDDIDTNDNSDHLFVQLRNAIISVPRNKFEEHLPLALYEDQLHMPEECKHQMVLETEQRRSGDEEFTVIETCRLCNYTKVSR